MIERGVRVREYWVRFLLKDWCWWVESESSEFWVCWLKKENSENLVL